MNDFDLYLSRTNEIMGERSIFELRMHRASNRVSTIERNRCPIKCGIRKQSPSPKKELFEKTAKELKNPT